MLEQRGTWSSPMSSESSAGTCKGLAWFCGPSHVQSWLRRQDSHPSVSHVGWHSRGALSVLVAKKKKPKT